MPTLNFTLDPMELRGFITGLEFALKASSDYSDYEFGEYEAMLKEKIEFFSNVKGYQDWLKEQGKSDE